MKHLFGQKNITRHVYSTGPFKLSSPRSLQNTSFFIPPKCCCLLFETNEGVCDVAAETVLAFNVAKHCIDAAGVTVLAPILVVFKGLLHTVQYATAARNEVLELTAYCLGISSCLVKTLRNDMPLRLIMKMGEFEREMGAVCRFVETYGAQTGCWRRITLGSRYRSTVKMHKTKLEDILFAVVIGVVTDTNRGVRAVLNVIKERDPPSLHNLADIPRAAPRLPRTNVKRIALLERVVCGLIDHQRNTTATVCLWGMGGGGKTVLASSVVRDDRVRSSFRHGIFWLRINQLGKSNITLFLDQLARELAAAPSNLPHHCPYRFDSANEASRHLYAVLNQNKLRCLVVLDNVWHQEVVNTFARTGFHILVSTRHKTVISPRHDGVMVVVGDMEDEESLKLLGKASEAHGPLPAEAKQVRILR